MLRTSYEVRSGKRLISFQNASTAYEALVEYLRSIGCRDDELTRLSVDSITWRGSVYRAIPLGSE